MSPPEAAEPPFVVIFCRLYSQIAATERGTIAGIARPSSPTARTLALTKGGWGESMPQRVNAERELGNTAHQRRLPNESNLAGIQVSRYATLD